jgi:aromatic ring-opening dioxygenase catalytic subunit (LigB family)
MNGAVGSDSSHPTRRRALLTGLAGGIGVSLAALGHRRGEDGAGEASNPRASEPMTTPSTSRLPVVFVPHGGGPWPFVDLGFGTADEQTALRDYLASVRALPATPPRALLCVSAHWEEPSFTVMTGESPPLYYDYYGFPPESYELTWPAKGSPTVARRVRDLLEQAGFESGADGARGFDHGTFVPLKLAYPDADVPCVQLSLKRGLDPAAHLALGQALSPLRDEGVFIIGSGMTFHNLRAFGPQSREPAEQFDRWLRQSATLPEAERNAALARWSEAPAARRSHPREEHLLPLLVVAGAAAADRATVPYNGTLMGLRLSAYHFG